jgi:HAD superfamily phosphatase
MSGIAVFDIDGVLRDVGGSYRRALADTVEQFTHGAYRPTAADIDRLKGEGRWNNDWEGSQELIYRYFESQGKVRSQLNLDYDEIVAFFQSRYRGPNQGDASQWTGYITQEPLLVDAAYFDQLTAAGIAWGFFSGATRGSACFVLEQRLGLVNPLLIAMEDAPGKPDPAGLFAVVNELEGDHPDRVTLPVAYAGDTVADMQTVRAAQAADPERRWVGVGVLPPHVQVDAAYAEQYRQSLLEAGATVVVPHITALTAEQINALLMD